MQKRLLLPGNFRLILSLAFAGWAGVAAASPVQTLNGDLIAGGTGAALGTLHKLADAFRKTHPGVQFTILPSLGSGGGIKALIAGRLSISVSSRPLTEEEQAKGMQAHEIARTPFVFATAMQTPVETLTLTQAADLYSGKTTTWTNGTQVRLVLRPLQDVDTDVVKNMSPALAQAVLAAHQREGKTIAVTDTDSADDLERIPGAIGTSTLALIKSEGRQLRPLWLDGIAPTTHNLANGKYRYHKSIYLVTPPQPTAVVQAFLKFIDSAAGSAILTQTGNLPVPQSK